MPNFKVWLNTNWRNMFHTHYFDGKLHFFNDFNQRCIVFFQIYIIHQVEENVRLQPKRWHTLCMVLNLSLCSCINMTRTTTHTTSLLKHLFKLSYLILANGYARHNRMPWPNIVDLVLLPPVLCVHINTEPSVIILILLLT